MSQASPDSQQQPDSPAEDADPLRPFQSTLEQWMQQWSGQMTALMEPTKAMSLKPERVVEAQWSLWQAQQRLWLSTTAKLLGGAGDIEEVASPTPGDRRFKDEAWVENPLFSFLKQSYLLNARWLEQMLDSIEGLDPDLRRNLEFYNQQLIDAMAPTNFASTNPEVLRTTVESKGQNLLDGLQNLLGDVQRSKGTLSISQTDLEAFEVGTNIAVSPGQVVFQNELIQLIQYEPTTKDVYRQPLLIVPPWINKYYILDLKPENSFIKWSVEQGYTVFVMSWVNPDERYRDKSFDDYARDGVLAAIDAVERAAGESRINTIGYCIGGTLLAMALAYLAAKGDERIASATFFAAQIDFEEAGCLRVFTGAENTAMLDVDLDRKGYLDGWQMASAFNLLRANDLIWPYVVNNYMLGKPPRAFELLYWNADATRFPARLLRDYLQQMYQRNLLATPGAFELLGEPIDLAKISIPTYIQASREDHIAPAPSVFKAMQRFSGERQFVLAGSGHIAGVVNPPSSGKYQHWTNASANSYDQLDQWLEDAVETAGSWWPHWHQWLSVRSGEKVKARAPGGSALAPIEPAPGSYVKMKC